MRRDTLFFLIAISCGILVFYLLVTKPKAVPEEKFQIVVAKETIVKGSVLKDHMLSLQEGTEEMDRAQYFEATQQVVGLMAIKNIAKGRPIPRSSTQNRLSYLNKDIKLPIPDGMGALTIFADEIDYIPNYIKTGFYLDVLGLSRRQASKLSVIVYSAQIISLERRDNGGIVSLTLALTQQESEAITSATEFGKIRIVVRAGKGDKDTYKPTPTSATMDIIRRVSRTGDIPVETKPEDVYEEEDEEKKEPDELSSYI